MFRKLRIAVLLVILATVALGAWRSGARATEWKHTLYATVYPIAADDSPHTRAGVARLSADDFAPITDWLQDEVRRHGRDVLRPLAISVAPPLESQPPPFPADGPVRCTSISTPGTRGPRAGAGRSWGGLRLEPGQIFLRRLAERLEALCHRLLPLQRGPAGRQHLAGRLLGAGVPVQHAGQGAVRRDGR